MFTVNKIHANPFIGVWMHPDYGPSKFCRFCTSFWLLMAIAVMNLVHGALTWCFLPWLSSQPHQHHSPNVILFLAAMLYADTCLFPGFVFLVLSFWEGGWDLVLVLVFFSTHPAQFCHPLPLTFTRQMLSHALNMHKVLFTI